MNYDLDIDLDEIQRIKNPQIKNLVQQLKMNGIAYHSNDDIGRKISRKFPEYRKKDKPVLIIGNDRKTNRNFIGFNFPEVDYNSDMDKVIKKIIKSFGGKL